VLRAEEPAAFSMRIGPVVVLAGTATETEALEIKVTAAPVDGLLATPVAEVKYTFDCGVKFDPLIVTVVPIGPLVGVKLLIKGNEPVGTNDWVLTADWLPLSTVVTVTGPVVTPEGTTTRSCVPLSQ
jgi:hypothetical protein